MRTMCSREILTKKSRQQQNFDSDLKGAWHYNHVTFTPIAKMFLLYVTTHGKTYTNAYPLNGRKR